MFEVTHSGSWPAVVRPVIEKVSPWYDAWQRQVRETAFTTQKGTIKISKWGFGRNWLVIDDGKLMFN